MDQQIVALLQERAQTFEEEFQKFPYKTDPAAVFAHECSYYLEPLSNLVIPLLARRLIENRKEKIEGYLPFIIPRYHETVIKEIEQYRNGEDSFSQKSSKEIVQSYLHQVLPIQSAPQADKDDFAKRFVSEHHLSLEQIATRSPVVALETLAKLRTPLIQYLFLQDRLLTRPIHEHIHHDLIHQEWSRWMERFFCYPRTQDLQAYFGRWIGRDALHIKMCRPLFESYYDQAKLWLKNAEKKRERES